MTMDSTVCSVRFHLCCNSKEGDEEDLFDLSINEEDLFDLSIKQVDFLDEVKISRVFHCDGLLLCVPMYNSSLQLLMWNPYLGQKRWIGLTSDFHITDCYALGYDINRNYKILRSLCVLRRRPEHMRYEIYEFSSNSWRVLKVTPYWEIESDHGAVSLKGNTYFYANKSIVSESVKDGRQILVCGNEYFLLCFDFTTERFGPRLPLPFHNYYYDNVSLSCVREKKLAVLYQQVGVNDRLCDIVHIWVTTKIDPNYVSWSKFLRVEIKPSALMGIGFTHVIHSESFFIDEEEKVAVVFDIDGFLSEETSAVRYHTASVIGQGGFGYFKSVSLGVALPLPSSRSKSHPKTNYCHVPLMCSSSYLPSLVQLNQPHKGTEKSV